MDETRTSVGTGSASISQDASASPAHVELLAACAAVLGPVARLAVAQGVTYPQIDELVKTAFVRAGLAAHAGVPVHRVVSRVSAATGLSRREVSRLMQPAPEEPPKRRSPATEVFTRWVSDPALRRHGAAPKVLPRQGPAPSFESLAQSVTRDVHPRSLLEELSRLGLARLDESGDAVELLRDTYVPERDRRRMFGFLGANVGDHLSAAVDNVLHTGPRHLEQALFADELSLESLDRVRPVVAEQWAGIVRNLAPMVDGLIQSDLEAGRPRDQRLRVGLYSFTHPMQSQDRGSASVVPSVQPFAKENQS